MTFQDLLASAAAVGVAMFISAGVSVPPAQAAYVVTLKQDGPNVVATGSGTISLAGLSLAGSGSIASFVNPSAPLIITGGGAMGDVDGYSGATAPSPFGSGLPTLASSASGDIAGADQMFISVPAGYLSGAALSGSATYDDATFASLGITPGVYVWTWGSGADADSFTLRASATSAIPEPSTWALLGVGFLGLAAIGLRARGKRQRRTPPTGLAARKSDIALASGR